MDAKCPVTVKDLMRLLRELEQKKDKMMLFEDVEMIEGLLCH